MNLKMLLLPFKSKSGEADADIESTKLGINWVVIGVVLVMVVGLLKLFVNMNNAVNSVTVGTLQKQNESITVNENYKGH